MATTMESLLKISAQVIGTAAVEGLTTGMQTLGKTADTTREGFKKLAESTDGLFSGMKNLVPLLTGAGLLGLAKTSLDAGDHMYMLSKQTGVSVETLSRFSKAAKVSGTDIDTVTSAMNRLSKIMVAAAGSGDEARRKQEELKRAIQAVSDGEKQQTDIVREQADARIAAINRETDRRLVLLGRRYRREEQLLSDKFDAAEEVENKRQEKQMQNILDGISQEYEIKKHAVEKDNSLQDERRQQLLDSLKIEQRDKEDAVRDQAATESKARRLAFRDQQQQQQDAIEDRKAAEEKSIKDSIETQKKQIENSRDMAIDSIHKLAAEKTEALKGEPKDQMQQEFDELGLSASSAGKIFKELGLSVKTAGGALKEPQVFIQELAIKLANMKDITKRNAIEMQLFRGEGPKLNAFFETVSQGLGNFKAMSGSFAEQAHRSSLELITLQQRVGVLGGKIAVALLPFLESSTILLTKMVEGFQRLPGPIQAIIGLLATFLITAGPIVTLFETLAKVGAVLSGLQLGTTIGGWLGIVGPTVTGIATALTGLLAWIGGTLIPGLVAFFSGPVGWTVLAVAAVVAMVVLFKEPIMQFLGWLGERVGAAFNFVTDIAKTAFQVLYAIAWQIWVQPWINLWNVVLREPATNALTWLQGVWTGFIKFFNGFVIQPIGKAWNGLMDMLRNAMTAIAEFFPRLWNGAINAVRNVINGFLGAIVNTINGIIANVDRLIDAFNKLPGPDIPLVPTLSVPRFATGGYVTGPTLGLIGEGGQPEYVIPADQMANVSASYMAGARGAAVLQGGGGAPQITIQTGPVMQLDGRQYVTVEDLQRTAQQVAEGVIGRLRTPAARLALGMR